MKITKFVKGITLMTIGFIIPINAIAEPDDTKYRCTRKGVKAIDSDYIESWSDIIPDFIKWCKE